MVASEISLIESYVTWARSVEDLRLRDALTGLYGVLNDCECRNTSLALDAAYARGMNPGVADLCLPVANDRYHALYLEFKVDGGRQSGQQMEFERWCIRWGNAYQVVRSDIEAIKVTVDYLSTLIKSSN